MFRIFYMPALYQPLRGFIVEFSGWRVHLEMPDVVPTAVELVADEEVQWDPAGNVLPLWQCSPF